METNFRIVAGSFYFKKQAEWGPCMYDSESYKTRQTYSNNLFHAELIWRNQGIAFIVFSLTAQLSEKSAILQKTMGKPTSIVPS